MNIPPILAQASINIYTKERPGLRVVKRLLPLDGLRGLAVMSVLAFHIGGGSHSGSACLRLIALITAQGWTGVTLFFVLSGFLVTGTILDSRELTHWWRHFYVRRTLRIFPLYYAALCAVLVAAWVAGTFHLAWSRIWAPAFFLQDIPGRPLSNINDDGSPLSLFHFWSLAIEEQFYMIWPVVLAFIRSKRVLLWSCASIVVSSTVILQLQGSIPWVSHLPMLIGRSGELAIGAWLAVAYRMPLWGYLLKPAKVLSAGCALGYAMSLRYYPHQAYLITSSAFLYASVLVLGLQVSWIGRVLSISWLRWIGRISYGIYVYHVLLGRLFWALGSTVSGEFSGTQQALVTGEITLLVTVPLSWASWNYFEKPLLGLTRYFDRPPV